MIVVSGMIGLGKSTCAEILADALNSRVLYEKVEGNRVLEKFYTETEENILKHRYPFLLQLEFLSSRYQSIKDALDNDNNVLDRAIYEDIHFKNVNHALGRISDLESAIYDDLFNNMMEELNQLQYKKKPDLMVYLKGSFETVLDRINKRGRGFEIDPSLKEYYYAIWKDYDKWVEDCYKESPVVVIDMDKMDVTKEEDKIKFIQMVLKELSKIR